MLNILYYILPIMIQIYVKNISLVIMRLNKSKVRAPYLLEEVYRATR